MTIRPAQASDRQAVEALVAAAYAHYVERIGTTPGPMHDDYAQRIADNNVYLLFDDDMLAGLVVLIPRTTTLLLENIAVTPALQGRGFGKMMMTLAETRARELKFDSITLYTHELMHENLELYRRHGYVETHRAEEIGLKRVYMQKPLI